MKKIALLLSMLFIFSLFGCSTNSFDSMVSPDIIQLKSICELATLECYYHNVAKSTKSAGTGITHWGEVDREFWIEYTGIAKIGIDLSEVTMTINGTVVEIYLPEAKLLSITIDESSLTDDSYIISNDGINKNQITSDDQKTAIATAQEEMKTNIESNFKLLANAQTRAKKLIENYINKIGELSGINYSIKWGNVSNAEINETTE